MNERKRNMTGKCALLLLASWAIAGCGVEPAPVADLASRDAMFPGLEDVPRAEGLPPPASMLMEHQMAAFQLPAPIMPATALDELGDVPPGIAAQTR